MVRNRTLKICGLVTMVLVVLVSASATAIPVLPTVGVVLYNELRTKPIPSETLGFTPSYSAWWPARNGSGYIPMYETYVEENFYGKGKPETLHSVLPLKESYGKLLGNNPRAYMTIATVPQGAVLMADPGITNRAHLKGVVAISNSIGFPEEGILVFPSYKGLPKWVEPKFLIPIDTSLLPPGIYDVKIRAIFRQAKRVFFWKEGYDESDCTHIWFMVQSLNDWLKGANDPEVQAALRTTAGLVGGAIRVGADPKIAIEDPNLAKELQEGTVRMPKLDPALEAELRREAERKYEESESEEPPAPAKRNSKRSRVPKAEVPESAKDDNVPEDPMHLDLHNGPALFADRDVIRLTRESSERNVIFAGGKAVTGVNVQFIRNSDGKDLMAGRKPDYKRPLTLRRADGRTAGLMPGEVYTLHIWPINSRGNKGSERILRVEVQ